MSRVIVVVRLSCVDASAAPRSMPPSLSSPFSLVNTIARKAHGPHALDFYFPSNTSGGGSISLLKASAVFANPRCASAPS